MRVQVGAMIAAWIDAKLMVEEGEEDHHICFSQMRLMRRYSLIQNAGCFGEV